jgi:multimeric flavodoxin WrbA
METLKLHAIALNCTLKSKKARDEKSSTDVLLQQALDALKKHNVAGEIVRVADLNIKPGVTADEGKGDDWPKLRKRILSADILIIGTPIWLGQPSSIAKRVFERMDAFFDEKDKKGRLPFYGKVGAVVVVGNEDGAHHVSAEIYQMLLDVGCTVPPGALTYWVGEVLGDKDYKDVLRTPKAVQAMTDSVGANVAHLARLLIRDPYPGS